MALRPSKDPDKKEALMIFEFRRNGKNNGRILPFHRDGKKIIYDEEMDMGGMKEFHSRLNFFLEDASGEHFEQEKIKQSLKMFEKDVSDGKIESMFNMLKKIKPKAVEGKTWQDMKDVMVKMIKDGKVGPTAERFADEAKNS